VHDAQARTLDLKGHVIAVVAAGYRASRAASERVTFSEFEEQLSAELPRFAIVQVSPPRHGMEGYSPSTPSCGREARAITRPNPKAQEQTAHRVARRRRKPLCGQENGSPTVCTEDSPKRQTEQARIGHWRWVRPADRARALLLAIALASCGRSDLYEVAKADGGPSADLDASVSSDSPVDGGADTPGFFVDAAPEAAPGPCNATTCPVGCCDGDTCITKISPNQCGASGQACVKCDPGDECKGVCFHPQVDCGPSNCPGCCFGTNYCASGTADVQCGTGGAQCVRCVPTEGTGQCLPNDAGPGGVCTVHECDSRTCTSGCCLNGTCMPGYSESACGTSGAPCQTCGPGEFCHGDGCRPGTPCTQQNCGGCCVTEDDGGVCLPGTTDIECGHGGYLCTSCQTAHQACVNGSCTVQCSPSTCRGCCDGNICAEGDQNFLCGTGGTSCQNCEPQGQTCISGACQ